jgi:hypothetical protein
MKKRPPLTDEEGEVRELTVEDFKRFRPIAEVDPGMIEAMKLMDANRRLRGAIEQALERYPKSRPDVEAIALAQDATAGSPDQRVSLERINDNLRSRAQALIKRHLDVDGLFKDLLGEQRG